MVDRKTMIKELWPDKLLYATNLTLIVGVLGLFYGILTFFIPVGVSSDIFFGFGVLLAFYQAPPIGPILIASLSAAAAIMAWRALETHSTKEANIAAILAMVSMGPFGLNLLIGLASFFLVILAKMEKEGQYEEGEHLTPDMWPDKTLSASLLLLVLAIITLGWGAMLATEVVTLDDEGASASFGIWSLICGAVAVLGSIMLYNQRGRGIGYLACVLGFFGFGGYIMGPALAIAALVMLRLAHEEGEFVSQGAQMGTAAPESPPPPTPPSE